MDVLWPVAHWSSALNIFNLSLPLTVDHIGKVFNHFLLHRSTKKSFSVVMTTNISCHKGLVMTTKKFSSLLMKGLAQHRDTISFFICPEIPLGNHQPWDTTIVTWTAIGNLSTQFHARLLDATFQNTQVLTGCERWDRDLPKIQPLCCTVHSLQVVTWQKFTVFQALPQFVADTSFLKWGRNFFCIHKTGSLAFNKSVDTCICLFNLVFWCGDCCFDYWS